MQNWIARFFLLLVVLIYYMVGSFLAFNPRSVGIEGIDWVTPETTTAFRVWGAFFYATAILGTFGVLRGKWTLQSLIVVTMVSTCVVAMRLIGMAVDGVDERNLGELQDESLGMVLAWAGILTAWFGRKRIN